MNTTRQGETFEEARAGLPDISQELSVYWKPLYRLFDEGNPIDPVTILLYDLGPDRRLPFAALAKTRGNRLILWPPSHAHEAHEFAKGDAVPIHHVTLELSNGETHFTRFEPKLEHRSKSKRPKATHKWQLADFDDGLKLWMIGAFRSDYLEKQVGVVGGKIRAPKNDAKRREDEFRRYAEQLTVVPVATPLLRGDCYLTFIYLVPDARRFQGELDRSLLPIQAVWNDWIADWPDGDKFQALATQVTVGDVSLLIVTAAPLGRLKGVCMLGSVDRSPALT